MENQIKPIISKDIETNRICSMMLTHSCNLKCVYCYEKFKSGKMMTFETAKEILTREFEDYKSIMAPEHRLNIDFMGGEPLLNFELIKQIYEWVKTQNVPFNIIYSVTTNGTLLDEEKRE